MKKFLKKVIDLTRRYSQFKLKNISKHPRTFSSFFTFDRIEFEMFDVFFINLNIMCLGFL